MKLFAIFTVFLFFTQIANAGSKLNPTKKYLGFRHIHNGNSHRAMNFMKGKIKPFVTKGRVNLYEVIDKKVKYKNLPSYVKDQFFIVEKKDLVYRPNMKLFSYTAKNKIKKLTEEISLDSYKNYVSSLVKIGPRNQNGTATSYLSGELEKLGLSPKSTDYNIISYLPGQSEEAIVIIGHMDTVRNTVGADDNASGASGVLELARVLSQIYKNNPPKYSFYFILSEDEEVGLLGAKKFVEDIEKAGKLDTLKLSINMDMIAYNENGIVDIETNKKNEGLALIFAQVAEAYTSLSPNLVLEPWGSDHMPFLNKNVPAVLSIESWESHTPCWHKSCDTIDSLNFNYAVELLKMNLAVILEKQDESF